MADLDVGDVVQIVVAAVVAGLALEPEIKNKQKKIIKQIVYIFYVKIKTNFNIGKALKSLSS